MRFNGKKVVVTGAARGLGKVMAKGFFDEGATVALLDIDLNEAQACGRAIDPTGKRMLAFQADVSNGREVEKAFQDILEGLGGIDILVNNAAVFAESVLIADLEEEAWDRVMSVNLKGVFNCSKAVIRPMMEKESGSIVNLTSFVGKTGRVVYAKFGTPTKAHYCASKAGIISLTRSLAYELAPHNIKVNAVAPGSVATEATDQARRDKNDPLVPFGRMGTAQEVAAAVLFMASDESSFITGETLSVNGGTLMD